MVVSKDFSRDSRKMMGGTLALVEMVKALSEYSKLKEI
jgi:hypothetical protein